MDRIKKHFEEESSIFDNLILQRIPRYDEMLDALISALPFDRDEEIFVVDLGCGTGTIAHNVKKCFKNSNILCLDFSENMLAMAEKKLRGEKNIEFINADLNEYEFTSNYDVVISSLALHHLATDIDKLNMYKRIYSTLNPNGVFYNADVILGSSEYIQSLNMNKWDEFVQTTLSQDAIDATYEKYYAEDVPAKVSDHLKWLQEAGFKNVDVIWKYYGSAVYGGIK